MHHSIIAIEDKNLWWDHWLKQVLSYLFLPWLLFFV